VYVAERWAMALRLSGVRAWELAELDLFAGEA
jgi:hypothetical protein